MNATNRAQSAYGPTSGATQTPRDVEYHAFARVTGALTAARDSGDFPALARAMYDNVRLWLTLAADAASDGNSLPPQLRAQIVSLATFSRTHAALVLRKADTPDALIDVNTAIMKGLRAPVHAAPPQPSAPQPSAPQPAATQVRAS